MDELKSECIKFVLENPIEEIEEPQEVNHQQNQSPSLASHQETNQQPSQAPSQPIQLQVSQPLESRPQANYLSPHRLHLPQRQYARPMPPPKNYTHLIANAFDK